MEVTFLFTKIAGSTELLQSLDDRRYGEVLAEHQRLLRAAFEAEGGQEVDTQGDAFFVAFPRASGAVAACRWGSTQVSAGPLGQALQHERHLVGDHKAGRLLQSQGFSLLPAM